MVWKQTKKQPRVPRRGADRAKPITSLQRGMHPSIHPSIHLYIHWHGLHTLTYVHDIESNGVSSTDPVGALGPGLKGSISRFDATRSVKAFHCCRNCSRLKQHSPDSHLNVTSHSTYTARKRITTQGKGICGCCHS